jgi:hypothetical protein
MLKPIIVILSLIAFAAFLVSNVNAGCSACKEGTDVDWGLSATSFLEGKPLVESDGTNRFSAKGARQSYEALKSKDTDEASSDMLISKATDPDSADPDATNPDASDPDATSSYAIADTDADSNLILPQRSESFSRVLVSVSAKLDADIVLDISPNATEYSAKPFQSCQSPCKFLWP